MFPLFNWDAQFWHYPVLNKILLKFYKCHKFFFVSFTVFIRKDVKGQAQLVLLDHGLYDKLTQDDRQSLCSLYKAIVLNKEDNMQKFSKALGVDGKW